MQHFFFALSRLKLMMRKYLTSAIKTILKISPLFVFFISSLLLSAAHAATPLWTIEPSAGSNPTQTVAENGTVSVQYQVQNQSPKSKRLVMRDMPGISKTTPCVLAPRGQAGSSCTLNVTITGSALPQEGIHHGPVLCQANTDDSPNPNQCYQPSAANSLNITRSVATGAVISVSPASLSFVAGANGFFTITNSSSSSEPANNVVAAIPGSSGIVLQSSTCGASLAVGASCTITLTASAVEGPTIVGVRGSNTNSSQVTVSVTPVPVSNISVSPTVLVFTQGMNGTLTVFNDSTSTVPATNVDAVIPAGSAITVLSNHCNSSLAVGTSCTIILTSAMAEGPTSVEVSGSNTNPVPVAVTVTATPTALLTVSPSSLMFTAGGTGSVNVTNSSGSTVTAINVGSVIPLGSNLFQQSNTCLPNLGIGETCSLTFTSNTPEGPTDIEVKGDNTTIENVAVTVTNAPTATISVNPSTLAFDAGSSGAVTVSNTSLVNAAGITASIPTGSNITVLNNSCTGTLAPGDNCVITFTSSVSTPATSVTINGSNTDTQMTTITVSPTCVPITLTSTPGITVIGSGQIGNLGFLTDTDLTNFVTMGYLILGASPSITMSLPSSTSYTKIGFKMASDLLTILRPFTFTAYQGNLVVFTATITPSSIPTEYTYFINDSITRITLSGGGGVGIASSYHAYYFCAGQ
ncbi:hypothetical protein ACD661_11870 [Legionella lytica]|uniref:Protein with a bacterial immunoglobulin-like domain protein n=1 Tax=Legionella lytica TaxID=96232 RepID=A0ABW8D969_9GAMM